MMTSPDKTDRRWILLSHANPEDNAATIWFATQLANEGYRVWSDVIDLAGGEDFWGGIEEVIRHRANKVVYLLSPASNAKEGCLRELSVAQGVAKAEKLKDFVIPLRIADVAHNDANIRIHPLNILESRSWNTGLAALRAKLEQDGVPRGPPKDFRASSDWWKARFATSRSVRHEPEVLASNWFRVRNPELQVHWHRLGRSDIGPIETPEGVPWPIFEGSGGIWTFAPEEALAPHLPSTYRIERTVTKTIGSGIESDRPERDVAFRLCNLAWHSHLQARGLFRHELANAKQCFAFPLDLIKGDEIHFQSTAGHKGHRTVVGYKMRINAQGVKWKRFWHFAIQPVPAFWPELMFMVRTHVLFSEDGKTLWKSAARSQKARRNQCKNWWNDTWRDRLLAVMTWLASGEDSIRLQVGTEKPLEIDARPIEFESPVSYLAPSQLVSDRADWKGIRRLDDGDEGAADDDDEVDEVDDFEDDVE
jgi:hypothetical protein